MKTSFIILSFLIAVVGAATSGEHLFETEALRRYKKCEECTRDDCLFYHEARDKCHDVCDDRIAHGDPAQQQPAGGGNHPAPVGGGHGGGGGGGGGGCFSGDSTVETNYGMMKMSDMLQKKNVQVLARHNNNNDLRLTPVQWWLHANASTEMNFVILTTETNQKLAITEYHLIYETDCRSHSRTIFAKKATPGKCVFVNDNGILKESKIVAKTEEIKVGIFAPITESGSIVVNDVLASCFTNFENEFLMKSIYSSMNLLQEFLTSVLPTSLIEIVSNTASFNFVDVPQTVLSLADITKFFSK